MGVDWGDYFGTEDPDEIDAIMCSWDYDDDDDYSNDPDFKEFAEEQSFLQENFNAFKLNFAIIWFKNGIVAEVIHEDVSLVYEDGALYAEWHNIRNRINSINDFPDMIDFMVDWDDAPCDNGKLIFTCIGLNGIKHTDKYGTPSPDLLIQISRTLDERQLHAGQLESIY